MIQLTGAEKKTLKAAMERGKQAENRAINNWCRKYALVKHGHKIGRVIECQECDPKARAVEVQWSDGTVSEVSVSALAQVTTDEQETVCKWCCVGVAAKHEGRIGMVTSLMHPPYGDVSVKLRWLDGTDSEYLKACMLTRLSHAETAELPKSRAKVLAS